MLKYGMKKIIVIMFLFIFPALAYPQLVNETQRPEITFDSESHDFGTVSQETVTYTFEFKNIGTSELVIKKISST